jgi:hypothetical protein
VEARVLGDVHHARPSEQGAVRIDDGRTIVGGILVSLEQIQDDDDAELLGERLEHLDCRARHWLSKIANVAGRRLLWVEGREGKLGKRHELCAATGRATHNLNGATPIRRQV